jgi:hypothetical protein
MHPTLDQLAELDEGLLPAAESASVTAHLADCAECRDARARLGEVSDLLAAAGRETPQMPADVAASVEAALARAGTERDAGVPSLAERRTGSEPDTAAAPAADRPRHRGRMLLGAAAAVTLIAVGGAVISNGLPGGSTPDESAAGTRANAQSAGGESGRAGNVGGRRPTADRVPATVMELSLTPRLNRDSVGSYAERLANGEVAGARPPARCLVTPTTQSQASASVPDALVEFDGQAAVLQVHPDTREFSVFSCPGPARLLYGSTY